MEIKRQKMVIEMLEQEYWYGSVVDDGCNYPFTKGDHYKMEIDPSQGSNQVSPLLLSTKGRYIWSDEGFRLEVAGAEIIITTDKSLPTISQAGETLKDAFLAASSRYFPSNGIVPPSLFFEKPQYNTWIEFIYNQNQEGILAYANHILAEGYPVGVLMIDDGWSDYYGKWKFNKEKFPNPKEMIEQLHSLGFKIMLWTCPFITPDTVEFKQLKEKGVLIKNQDDSIAIKEWWNGFSAVLDMSNPEAVKWYSDQNNYLMQEYGVDGFKFDSGDPHFYSENDVTFGNVTPNQQCQLWAQQGLNYEYNEYRACFKEGGKHLVQRLADKDHSWGVKGMASLVPNQLIMGLLGYPYSCPDMIGGGEYLNFIANSERLDEELFVRYAQCAALMPMMQFSAAPWRVLDQENSQYCYHATLLHEKYSEVIMKLAVNASKTGEPITRYLEYEYPNQQLEKITNQFLLGENIMVAPIIEKGERGRQVTFPVGTWQQTNQSKKQFQGPIVTYVEADLGDLLIFKRQ